MKFLLLMLLWGLFVSVVSIVLLSLFYVFITGGFWAPLDPNF